MGRLGLWRLTRQAEFDPLALRLNCQRCCAAAVATGDFGHDGQPKPQPPSNSLARQKRSNTCCRLACDKPGPLSSTSITAISPVRRCAGAPDTQRDHAGVSGIQQGVVQQVAQGLAQQQLFAVDQQAVLALVTQVNASGQRARCRIGNSTA